MNSSIGKLIKKYREELKLTAAELGEKIGFSQSSISHVENGRREPSREMLEEIAKVFNMPVERLLEESKSIVDSNDEKITIEDGSAIELLGSVTDIIFIVGTRFSKEALKKDEPEVISRKKMIHEFDSPFIKEEIINFFEEHQEEIINRFAKRIEEERKKIESAKNEYKIETKRNK